MERSSSDEYFSSAYPTSYLHAKSLLNSDTSVRFTQNGRNAQAAIPHAQFAVLPTGHEPFAEDPEAFLQVIEPFLRSVEAERNSHVPSNSPGTH